MNDKETLHYMRGKLDSLHDLVEKQIEIQSREERRLRKVERQVYAIWILGPVLTALVGAGYAVKRLIL